MLPIAEPKEVEEEIQDVLSLAKVCDDITIHHQCTHFVIFCDDVTISFQDTKIIDELDFVNLAPRKPDWDLKRDIAK